MAAATKSANQPFEVLEKDGCLGDECGVKFEEHDNETLSIANLNNFPVLVKFFSKDADADGSLTALCALRPRETVNIEIWKIPKARLYAAAGYEWQKYVAYSIYSCENTFLCRADLKATEVFGIKCDADFGTYSVQIENGDLIWRCTCGTNVCWPGVDFLGMTDETLEKFTHFIRDTHCIDFMATNKNKRTLLDRARILQKCARKRKADQPGSPEKKSRAND